MPSCQSPAQTLFATCRRRLSPAPRTSSLRLQCKLVGARVLWVDLSLQKPLGLQRRDAMAHIAPRRSKGLRQLRRLDRPRLPRKNMAAKTSPSRKFKLSSAKTCAGQRLKAARCPVDREHGAFMEECIDAHHLTSDGLYSTIQDNIKSSLRNSFSALRIDKKIQLMPTSNRCALAACLLLAACRKRLPRKRVPLHNPPRFLIPPRPWWFLVRRFPCRWPSLPLRSWCCRSKARPSCWSRRRSCCARTRRSISKSAARAADRRTCSARRNLRTGAGAVNGFRINDSQTAHHNLDLPIPLDAMDSIEVLHGAGSTLHGADALSGVVDFLTAAPSASSLRLRAGGAALARTKSRCWAHWRASDGAAG
jgi:hypothetical protein